MYRKGGRGKIPGKSNAEAPTAYLVPTISPTASSASHELMASPVLKIHSTVGSTNHELAASPVLGTDATENHGMFNITNGGTTEERGSDTTIPSDPISEPALKDPTSVVQLRDYASNILITAGLSRYASSVPTKIFSVPVGVYPASFVLSRLLSDGEISPELFGDSEIQVFASAFEIPDGVTNDVRSAGVKTLYPLSNTKNLPPKILVFKIKSDKNTERLAPRLLERMPMLAGSTLLFHGTSRQAVREMFKNFSLVQGTGENELGVGIYTTPSLEYALQYAGNNGVLMVFSSPDVRGLNIWKPDKREWENLTALQYDIPLKNLPIPKKFDGAEVVIGAISIDSGRAVKECRYPTPGAQTQTLFVSMPAVNALSISLKALVYLEMS